MTNDETISKQAVDTLVDELARAISDEKCNISRGRSTATIMRDIRHLPPVKPQPEMSEWVSKGDVYPAWKYCKKCGEPWTFNCGTPDFCPACGRKMKKRIAREKQQLINTGSFRVMPLSELPKHTQSLPSLINLDNGVKPYVKVNVIHIPDNATNGEKVRAMFPNYHLQVSTALKSVNLYYEGSEEYTGSYIRFDLDWWNAKCEN